MSSPVAPFDPRFLETDEVHTLLLKAGSMPGADLRVLLYYATAVPVGQPVSMTATDIGKALGLSTTSASRSVGRLVQGGWLKLAYTAVSAKFYSLNPGALGSQGPTAVEDQAAEQPLAQVHQLRPGS